MSWRHGSRVKQTSTTTGTGTLSLIAPSSQFQSFNTAFGAGPLKVFYCIAGTTYFEGGIGTFDNAGPTLTRDTILFSSNGGAAVSLPVATHDVFCWEPALFPVAVLTGSPSLAVADLFGLQLYTGTGGTLSLPAVASCPPGAFFPVHNLGTGALTIDPNASETINGLTTLVLLPGESAWVHLRDTATAAWTALTTQKRRARNAQIGTTYTYLTTDNGKHVTHSNAAAIAGTLPVAAAATFPDGFEMLVENVGAGALTITPTTSTINGAASLVLRKGQWALISSDGTNYRAVLGGVPTEVIVVAVGDETTSITTGVAKVTFRMPFAMTLTAVRASLSTASSSGLPTVDINEAGATVLSTKLSIDANEKTSTTAATAAVISDAALADDAEITIDIDVAGTGAKGLKVMLIGVRA